MNLIRMTAIELECVVKGAYESCAKTAEACEQYGVAAAIRKAAAAVSVTDDGRIMIPTAAPVDERL